LRDGRSSASTCDANNEGRKTAEQAERIADAYERYRQQQSVG
jgi:hypothetical protein